MKKIFTFSIAAALCAAASAQEMKIFSCGLGIPGIDEPQLMAEAAQNLLSIQILLR